MNGLSKFLVESILNEKETGITVLLPGGFKPPHEGHLLLALGYEELPNVEKVKILIGPKDRDGIRVEESEKIWEILLQGNPNIEVERSKYPSPLLTAYKFIEQAEEGTYALGSSSKGSDYDRIRQFVDSHQEGSKYHRDGIAVVELPLEASKPSYYRDRSDDENGAPISASQLRADIAAEDFENFKTNYPSIKSEQALRKIYDLLVKKNMKEDTTPSQSTLDEVNLKQKISDLKTKFKTFVSKIMQEGGETKEAFRKLIQAVKEGEKLSKEERKEIGDQLKDVLKLAGFTAATVLPGGVVYLLLTKVSVLQKHMVPSAFLNENRVLLNEGGAAGHMKHPYEDMDLTFDEMEKMIEATLSGKVDYVQEKLDGQNLMVSYKDGKVIAARNKGQVKNKGEKALTTNELQTMMSGKGAIETAFTEAMRDLTEAISKLTPEQKEEFFANGKKFISLEILYPDTANVVPYGATELRLHHIKEYDDSGNVVDEDTSSMQKLQQALDQVEASETGTFAIKTTDLSSIKRSKDYTAQKTELLDMLRRIKDKYNLTKSDKLGLYFNAWWKEYVELNAKQYDYELDDDLLQNLINRWAFTIKKPTIVDIKKKIKNDDFKKWVNDFDKNFVKDQKKIAMKPIEDLFLKLGVYVLQNLEGLVAVNPNKTIASMKFELDKAINIIQKAAKSNSPEDDDASVKFLKAKLQQLEKLGGFKAILPTEGIVFKHNDKLYKLTGAFAPINQIIGYIKFGR